MKTCRIGRGADNDIVYTHNEVSTYHAELVEDNGTYTIIDHSKNGTIVNHTQIHNTSCVVQPGDSIVFAGVEKLDWKKVSKLFHTTIPISFENSRRPTATTRGNQGKITIGRGEGNDIVYDSQEISNSHADIIDRDGCYFLIDHSKNGTFVNGNRIHNDSCSVNYGDSIVFAGVEELNWKKVARLFNKTIDLRFTKRLPSNTRIIQRNPESLPSNNSSDVVNENYTNDGKSYSLVVFLLGLVALGIDVYLFIDFYTSTFIRLIGFMGASRLAWFPAYLNGYGLVHGKWLFIIASIVIGGITDFVANVMDEKDEKLTSTGSTLANIAISLSFIFLVLAIIAPYIYRSIQ